MAGNQTDLRDHDKKWKEIQRERDDRLQGYRERALGLFPWVCAKCGREFSGKRLVELTVHHRDHNHDNNPPDGSNWELLCVYCHDNEHSRMIEAEWQVGTKESHENKPSATAKPFANLDKLLKLKTDKP